MTEHDAPYGKSLRESEVEKVLETASGSVIRHPSVSERGSDAPSLVVVPASGKSTCGAHGGLTKDGSPCSQPVFNGRRRCGWHPEGLEGEAATAHRSTTTKTPAADVATL